MRAGPGVCSTVLAAVCLIATPASAFDTRAYGPPPTAFAGPGAVYDYGPGFALLRPWYLDREFRTRRYYRARDPHQYPMPVYIEPNYRLSGGYPHAYPLTGYVYPYPRTYYVPLPPPVEVPPTVWVPPPSAMKPVPDPVDPPPYYMPPEGPLPPLK